MNPFDHAQNSGGGRVLGAILMNPPTGSGAISRQRVAAAQSILGCETFVIANLFPSPTRGFAEIEAAGANWQAWEPARESLLRLADEADEILFAWGVHGFSGETRGHFDAQISWMKAQLLVAGHEAAWLVNGETRHPSRWHQYVSDRHGRTAGGSFEQRLRTVLVAVPIR